MIDLEFVRAQFPALDSPWTLLDNAGGSAPCKQVIEGVTEHMRRRPVQLGASYPLSQEASSAIDAGREAAAELLGSNANEIVLGASSTVLVQQLAKSLCANWKAGDEVIVTNVDHEANVGPWRRLESEGIVIREWQVRPETCELHWEDLEALLGERTRLVAFTHSSNVVGRVHDVKTWAGRLRESGVQTCVDGVAYAPHRRVDVRSLGVDYYVVSLYKVYGPHLGVMFGRRERLLEAKGNNHFFVSEDSVPYKLEPGNVSYELAASLVGIREYFREFGERHGLGADSSLDACFELIAQHETELAAPLLRFLREHPRTRVIGDSEADSERRVPTVSFTVDGMRSSEVPPRLEKRQIAVRFGDFYALRLIQALGLESNDGVVRASLVHYNTHDEVSQLIEALDDIL